MPVPMRAKTTFAWGQRVIAEGDIVSSDDPVMKKQASLFEPVVVESSAPIEQATAAPGEKRNVQRKKKGTA